MLFWYFSVVQKIDDGSAVNDGQGEKRYKKRKQEITFYLLPIQSWFSSPAPSGSSRMNSTAICSSPARWRTPKRSASTPRKLAQLTPRIPISDTPSLKRPLMASALRTDRKAASKSFSKSPSTGENCQSKS